MTDDLRPYGLCPCCGEHILIHVRNDHPVGVRHDDPVCDRYKALDVLKFLDLVNMARQTAKPVPEA